MPARHSLPTLRTKRLPLAAVLCLFSSEALTAADFHVTATAGENSYTINGVGWDPPLTLIRGKTYTFSVDACDCHPVIIEGAPAGTVDNNNIYSGTITFRVPEAEGFYAYRCFIHSFGAPIRTIAPPVTVIRLTGPAAFRAATHAAIANIMAPGFSYGYTGSSLAEANQAVFTGVTAAPVNAPVIIKTHWGGTMEGLKSVTENNPLASAWLANDTPQTGSGAGNAPAAYEPATAPADITLTECYQSSSPYRKPALVDRVVGVVPYQWVRNYGSPATLDNMTPWLATNLLSGGLPLSQFSGTGADSGTTVLGTGQDENAGARLACFAESGFGIYSSPIQYRVNIATSPFAVQSLEIWPPATVLGTPWGDGHSGEADGAALAAKLSAPGSHTAAGDFQGWVVSYAGIHDAAAIAHGPAATVTAVLSGGSVTGVNVISGGSGYGSGTTVIFSGGGGNGAAGRPVIVNGVITGVAMTGGGGGYASAPAVTFHSGAAMKWNGIDYSPDAVREGQYTFWSYQHLYYRPGFASAAVADQLATRIRSVEAALTGVKLSTMNVERFVEGGDVTPGNRFP